MELAIVILIGLDIGTGFLNAILTKSLTSKRSYIGMFKKASILAAIVVAYLAETYLHIEGIGELVTIFFMVTESLSILENLKSLGIPIPSFLTDIINSKEPKGDDKDDDTK